MALVQNLISFPPSLYGCFKVMVCFKNLRPMTSSDPRKASHYLSGEILLEAQLRLVGSPLSRPTSALLCVTRRKKTSNKSWKPISLSVQEILRHIQRSDLSGECSWNSAIVRELYFKYSV